MSAPACQPRRRTAQGAPVSGAGAEAAGLSCGGSARPSRRATPRAASPWSSLRATVRMRTRACVRVCVHACVCLCGMHKACLLCLKFCAQTRYGWPAPLDRVTVWQRMAGSCFSGCTSTAAMLITAQVVYLSFTLPYTRVRPCAEVCGVRSRENAQVVLLQRCAWVRAACGPMCQFMWWWALRHMRTPETAMWCSAAASRSGLACIHVGVPALRACSNGCHSGLLWSPDRPSAWMICVWTCVCACVHVCVYVRACVYVYWGLTCSNGGDLHRGPWVKNLLWG